MIRVFHVEIETLVSRGVLTLKVPSCRCRSCRQLNVPVKLVSASSRDVGDRCPKSADGYGQNRDLKFGHFIVHSGVRERGFCESDCTIFRGLRKALMKLSLQPLSRHQLHLIL